jgi:hypothetical protein
MLMLACFGGHVETAKALIRAGARLDDRNAWDCDVVCTEQLRVVGFRLMNVQRC